MTKELEQVLYKKYPILFQNTSKPPTESCMAFGCEIDDGWYYLLDNLCKQITDYVKYQHNLVDTWDRIEEKRKTIPKKGWEVDRPDDAKLKISPVILDQVKEKFGRLTIYYSGGDDRVSVIVNAVSELSFSICETCGKFDNTVGHTTKGWIRTICKDCSKNPIYEDRSWTLNNSE